MRIIAGRAGRRAIKVPKGVTRPTTDFVRQALFSMLGTRVIDSMVLDLFAGSGALGLEALSRGAKHAVFVDESRVAERVLRENLESCQLTGGKVFRAEVHAWLRRERSTFDLIFADPPYARSLVDRDHLSELAATELVGGFLKPNGLFIAEQAAEMAPVSFAGLTQIERRTYGGSAILLYGRAEDS